jgi:hypothetical protein
MTGRPTSGFVIVIWVAAALVAALKGFPLVEVYQVSALGPDVLRLLASVLYDSGILVALGIVIQLLDSIRWNTLALEYREAEVKARKRIWWLVRNWPRPTE